MVMLICSKYNIFHYNYKSENNINYSNEYDIEYINNKY